MGIQSYLSEMEMWMLEWDGEIIIIFYILYWILNRKLGVQEKNFSVQKNNKEVKARILDGKKNDEPMDSITWNSPHDAEFNEPSCRCSSNAR